MSSSVSKRALNRQRWRERVGAWKQSGESQQAFCQRHHLGLSSFQRWCRIFKSQERSSELNSGNSEAVNFLPVSVNQVRPRNLSVVVDDDLRIDIPADFDPHALGQLIQVLRRS